MTNVFYSEIIKIFKHFRDKDWGFNIGNDIFTKEQTMIVLIGNKDHYSPFHLDWARAKNWAILLHIKV